MKKILLLVLSFCQLNTFAQNAEVVNAYNYLKYGELDKAMESIEKASVDEKTSTQAKTFYYKGLIYQSIDMTEEPRYKSLSQNALLTSYEAFLLCIELDSKRQYTEDIKKNMPIFAAKFLNAGITAYTEKNFSKALNNFEMSLKINPLDTPVIYNSAIASQLAKNNEKSKYYLNRLIELNYEQSDIYRTLSSIYKAEGDTAKALEVLDIGKSRFPGNATLIIDELNIYLAKGQTEKILTKLQDAIQADSVNKSLYFALGTTYDNLGKKEEAIVQYKKAIEFDPAYFDAIYNLGALYYNRAVESYNYTNALPVSKTQEFDKGKAKFSKEFKEALPYLENALLLNPVDKNTLISLKEIYAKTEKYEKSKEMKNRLDALK